MTTVDGGCAGEYPWEFMLGAWRELDMPEGWRAEIDHGRIVLSPPRHAYQHLITADLHRALCGVLPPERAVCQRLGIDVAALGKLYVPGLVVVPFDVLRVTGAQANDPVDAGEALLVTEIPSADTAQDARAARLWAYAHAPVPVYLLIDGFDPHGPAATLFTNPENGVYKDSHRVAFGEVLELPEPFALKLDTGAFPV